jgi:hypothetical protein
MQELAKGTLSSETSPRRSPFVSKTNIGQGDKRNRRRISIDEVLHKVLYPRRTEMDSKKKRSPFERICVERDFDGFQTCLFCAHTTAENSHQEAIAGMPS